MRRSLWLSFLLVALGAGCSRGIYVPAATRATPTPTASPTIVASATPTVKPTATASAAASPTASPAASPTASPSVSPTASPTASPTVSPTASPTATPTATPTPGPLSASPSSLTFNGTNQTQNVTIADPGFGGTYSVSGCSGVATYGAVSGGTLMVTSQAAGTCTITIGDSFNTTTVGVSVTTLTVPVQ